MDLRSDIKRYIFWERSKKWIILIIIVIFIVAIGYYGSYISILLPWLSLITQDPIVATLIGAVFGGAIAFYGSVYVQRYQVKSEAAIRRRDDIFIPLYVEILDFRKTLQANPCPNQFVFSVSDGYHNDPKFVIWNSFMNDSRKLQVPGILANSLNDFIVIMKHYNRTRKAAVNDINVDKVIRGIIVANSVMDNLLRSDFTIHYLPCNKNLSKIKDLLHSETSRIEGNRLVEVKTEHEIDSIAQKIYLQCSEIESVKEVQKYRQLIDINCDELIDALEIIIKYINGKFEHNAKWF